MTPYFWRGSFTLLLWWPEAVSWVCSIKKVFLEISQNSQENICARVSFLRKFLIKKVWHRCFPANFAKFLRTPFSTEHLLRLLLSGQSTTKCNFACHKSYRSYPNVAQQILNLLHPEKENIFFELGREIPKWKITFKILNTLISLPVLASVSESSWNNT